MLTCDEYVIVRSLREAFDCLAANAGRARIVAGATDVVPWAREGRAGDVHWTVNGRTTTPGLAKYILPTALDVPTITSVIVEDPDPIGPLGVKGIGEPAMVPTIPAVMNAIYDAVGIRITSLPAMPEKVLMAIKNKDRAAQHRVAAEQLDCKGGNACQTA